MRFLAVKFIVLICFISVFAQDQRAQFEALRAEGYEALYNLDYEGARKRFQKMIELAPDHPAGAQCFASSLWFQQLNEAWQLKSTLYSTEPDEKPKPQLNRAQVEEFRKWIRTSKQLSQARLKKDAGDVEALYFLGAAEGLEAAFAGGVEGKYRAALRSGNASVDRHKEVLKISPDFRDAELTIGLLNYVIGSLPLPVKMIAATMGVKGSKKRGLEALERVSTKGHWARDAARVVLVDLYKREKRWTDAYEMASGLSEKYPRNYIFKLQMADARVSEILALRKKKASTAAEEQQVSSIFASLLRDKTLDRKTVDLINSRFNITRQQ
ncbi:MAG TPA: hypothetical protein VFS77_21285, partial [Pyrinomonadaceae bacterium]|nr:hypothetical protein [Pyrinomonadaceae bacterium]